jgi:hypothetical protein
VVDVINLPGLFLVVFLQGVIGAGDGDSVFEEAKDVQNFSVLLQADDFFKVLRNVVFVGRG